MRAQPRIAAAGTVLRSRACDGTLAEGDSRSSWLSRKVLGVFDRPTAPFRVTAPRNRRHASDALAFGDHAYRFRVRDRARSTDLKERGRITGNAAFSRAGQRRASRQISGQRCRATAREVRCRSESRDQNPDAGRTLARSAAKRAAPSRWGFQSARTASMRRSSRASASDPPPRTVPVFPRAATGSRTRTPFRRCGRHRHRHATAERAALG